MANYMHALSCCGASELVGINQSNWTAEGYLQTYITSCSMADNAHGRAFLPFSYAYDVRRVTSGTRTRKQGKKRMTAFKKYIEDNKFGTVTLPTTSEFNGNYGKKVRILAGLFVPNNKNIHKYANTKSDGLKWESPL